MLKSYRNLLWQALHDDSVLESFLISKFCVFIIFISLVKLIWGSLFLVWGSVCPKLDHANKFKCIFGTALHSWHLYSFEKALSSDFKIFLLVTLTVTLNRWQQMAHTRSTVYQNNILLICASSAVRGFWLRILGFSYFETRVLDFSNVSSKHAELLTFKRLSWSFMNKL